MNGNRIVSDLKFHNGYINKIESTLFYSLPTQPMSIYWYIYIIINMKIIRYFRTSLEDLVYLPT